MAREQEKNLAVYSSFYIFLTVDINIINLTKTLGCSWAVRESLFYIFRNGGVSRLSLLDPASEDEDRICLPGGSGKFCPALSS